MTKICLVSLPLSLLVVFATSSPIHEVFEDEDELQFYNWEYIELQLLSQPNVLTGGMIDAPAEFHVVRAKFIESNSTYILHLTKPHGLFHPQILVKSDGDDNTDIQCLYEGIANEVIRYGIHILGGTLSLSICDHQEYSGFEGLLLLHDQQYYIKPDVVGINDNNENVSSVLSTFNESSSDMQAIKQSHKLTIRHKAYKISNATTPFSNDLDETLQVPLQDMQRWAKNSSINYDILEDEEILTLSPVFMVNVGKRIHIRNNSVTNKSLKNTTTTQKVVEIAVFTDEKLYSKWKSRFPKNTTGKVKQYILSVVNNVNEQQMNALYNQPSMTEKITFRLVNIEIATKQPKSLNDNNGQVIPFLRSFCSYAAEKNLQGTLWDHAILLTGVDLSENGNNITAGIAWYSTMCINGLSCSVVEGTSFSSAFVSTHEVGHSLGMDHDGSTLNADCNANSSIMSPTTGGGKTSWSKCSIRNMKQFLGRGYLGVNPPKCLFKKSSKQGGGEIKYSGGKMPGQQFPAKVQCSSYCGSKCTPHVTKKAPYNDICYLLHCKQKQGQFTIVESIHPALEGTPCAKGKVCRLGKCRK